MEEEEEMMSEIEVAESEDEAESEGGPNHFIFNVQRRKAHSLSKGWQ
jgi:hypothetical protein